LSQLSESYKDLRRLDVQLAKHTSELEDFEHSSKQDRAKAFSGKLQLYVFAWFSILAENCFSYVTLPSFFLPLGNSKLLIEEEKFRKTGKKKFEQISEKLLISFNKFQLLSTTVDGIAIELKPDLEALSEHSRALIKGKLKERAELMHLELISSHGSGGAVVPKAPISAGPMRKLSIASSPMRSPSPGPKNLTLFGLRPTNKAGKHPTNTANHSNSSDENFTSNDANASVHIKSSADESPRSSSRVRIIL
jgi:hypothetical protein